MKYERLLSSDFEVWNESHVKLARTGSEFEALLIANNYMDSYRSNIADLHTIIKLAVFNGQISYRFKKIQGNLL